MKMIKQGLDDIMETCKKSLVSAHGKVHCAVKFFFYKLLIALVHKQIGLDWVFMMSLTLVFLFHVALDW